jgi:plastocyanin
MSEREHIVSLNRGVDYTAFNQEMISLTGAGAIPDRSVAVANTRPGSQRNTHYNLTDAEAEILRNDSRVYGVTLLPELDPSIGIGFSAIQSGNFTKTTLDRGDFLNWGMRRMNEAANPYTGVNAAAGGYNYTLDGTGVDVVIMDSGIQADHPEFQDADGVSRVQQIDWTSASGIAGMPAQNANYYRDYDGHGTHVAGTAVGKTYGWAKNAKIFSVKLAGLEGAGDSGTGTSATYVFDCIKEWHNAKPNDAATGAKRPTVVNMSWGYLRYYNTVINLTYRGVLKTGSEIDTEAKRWAFGLPPASGGTSGYTYTTNLRVTSADTDVQEMIDAGIHVVVAAGNRGHKIDVQSGNDFGNFIAADTGSNEYQKGSSPYDNEAHIVGSIDSTVHAGSLDQKATYSETGPGVSIYAPGTDIMSAMSTTNKFSATVLNNPYPADDSFLINNISGTSMASPQIAGMLALWLQLNPSATPAQGLAFLNGTAKTAQIYETGSAVDYADTRSLLGSANRFAFNKFNSNVQMRLGTPLQEEEAAAAATYLLSTASASVNEGSVFTITLTTTNIDDTTVIPYTITGVSSADLSGASLTGNFTVAGNNATVTFTVAADATTEGTETFLLSLDALSVTQSVTINDTSVTPGPTYAVAPASASVNEGSALVFNVTTANVADATTLYWTVTSASDFSTTTGSFAISSNSGSFSVTPTADTTTEGAETFTASVRTGSASGSIVATSSTVTINDTSTTPGPTYAVAPASGSVNEGSALTFNITTTNVTDATTLYWTATNASDFSTSSGSFTISSNAGSVAVTPTADTTTEGAETFTLQIRTVSVSGTIVATSSTVTINDTSTTPSPTYAVAPAANNVDEGSALTFNITTTNVADATTLYWTVTSASDFSTSTGSFAITSNAGSVAVTPTADSTTEGAETFTLQIRTGSTGGTIVVTSSTVTINDTSTTPGPTYDATPASASVNEGSALTINVATTNVSDATTLYWTATNSGDFSTASGSFAITSDTGSFTVTPTADTTTEGAETFQIQIRTDSISGTIVDTSDAITINDTSTTPGPTYAVAPASGSVNEGSALVFNVSTANVDDATTLYWTVTNAGDFSTSSGSFAISSNAGTFSVTPTADATTEGAETFTAQIRTGSTGGTIVVTSSAVTINDTSAAAGADYTINVGNNGASDYTLSGTDRNGSVSGNDPALAFNNGDVVDFVVSASGHPFWIKTAQVTGTGSGATGVSNNGTQSGTVQWTVGSTGTFYYICQYHAGMVGTITAS